MCVSALQQVCLLGHKKKPEGCGREGHLQLRNARYLDRTGQLGEVVQAMQRAHLHIPLYLNPAKTDS